MIDIKNEAKAERVEQSVKGWKRLTDWLAPEGDGLTLLFSAFVLLNVSWLLEKAGWEEGLPSISGISVAALVSGFVLVKKSVLPMISHLIFSLTGVGLAILFGASAVPVDGWTAKLKGLMQELASWGQAAMSPDVMREGNIEFIMLLVVLFWVLGYLASWYVLQHRQALLFVLSGGLVVLIALVHLPQEFYFHFILYLTASILLLVHVNLLKQQKEWGLRQIGYRPILGVTRLGFVVAFGLVAVLGAWKVPVIEAAPLGVVVDVAKAPVEFIQDNFSRLFSSLPAKKPFIMLRWGNSLSFGGPPQLSDQILFTVESKEPRYWRAIIYDLYTPLGWRSSPTMQRLLTNELLQEADEPQAMRVKLSHSVRLNAATDTLFLAGEPVNSSLPAIAITRFNQPKDIFSVRNGQELRLSQKYTVVSNVSAAKPEHLREAGTNYPNWVSENYLQLPSNLPRRILRLSNEITASAVTPYDKAMAIQDYLKAFPYNLNIKAPPVGRDGVDYFLFSQKAGYCDYFASAMVVMLRSAGIPARFVVGYATGEWDSVKKVYIVRELHYHSWVDVYFPGYGWVEFEPTPPDAIEFTNQPPLSPLTLSDTEEDPGEDILEDELPAEMIDANYSVYSWLIVSGMIGVLLVLAFSWYRWWGMLMRLDYPAEIYSKMCRLGSLVRISIEPHFTPLEYAERLSTSLPGYESDIKHIAEYYGKTRYSHRKILPVEERDQMEKAWIRLRRALLKKVISQNLRK